MIDGFKNSINGSKLEPDWLHYGFLISDSEIDYPKHDMENFASQLKEADVKFFFNVISQYEKWNTTELASIFGGIAYSINDGVDIKNSIIEALISDPFKKN